MLRYYIVLFPLAAHSVAIRHRFLYLSVKPESVIRFLFIFAYMCARLGHDFSSHGFVIRAEGLCGFEIRSYITRGLQIPVNMNA